MTFRHPFVYAALIAAPFVSAEVRCIDYTIQDKGRFPIPVAPGVTTTVRIDAKVIATPGQFFSLDKGTEEKPKPFVGGTQITKQSYFLTFTPGLQLPAGVETNLNVFLEDGRSFVLIPRYSNDPAAIVRFLQRGDDSAGDFSAVAAEMVKNLGKATKGEPAGAAGIAQNTQPQNTKPDQGTVEAQSPGAYAKPVKPGIRVLGISDEPPPAAPYDVDESDIITFQRFLQLQVADPTIKLPGVTRFHLPKVVFSAGDVTVKQESITRLNEKDCFAVTAQFTNSGKEPVMLLPGDIAVRLGNEEPIQPNYFSPDVFQPGKTVTLIAIFTKQDAHAARFDKTPAQLTMMPRRKSPTASPAATAQNVATEIKDKASKEPAK